MQFDLQILIPLTLFPCHPLWGFFKRLLQLVPARRATIGETLHTQKRKSIIDISSDVATTTGREAWWLLNRRAASNSKGASYTQFSSYCSGTMSQQQYTINDFKSTVNSFLYRLNGSKTHHQDPTRLSSVDTRFSSAWTMALEFSHTIYGIANY